MKEGAPCLLFFGVNEMNKYTKVLNLLNTKKWREASAAAKSLDSKIATNIGRILSYKDEARTRQIAKCKKLLRTESKSSGIKVGKKVSKSEGKKMAKRAGSTSHRHDAMQALQENMDV